MAEDLAGLGRLGRATSATTRPRTSRRCGPQCPVHHVRLADGHDAWVVLGHDAARQALKDPRLSKDMLAALAADPDVVDEGLPGPAFARHMLAVDPPDHTRLRRLVARAFAPSRIAALEPADRAHRRRAARRARAARARTVVDLVAGFALPLPVPRDRRAARRARAPTSAALHDAFRTLFRPWRGAPPPEAVRRVGRDRRLPRATSSRPAPGAPGRRPRRRARRRPAPTATGCTDQELLSSLFQLIVAGHDTTDQPHRQRRRRPARPPRPAAHAARADPARLAGAVEELIRYSAPVPHATFRVTTEPVELDGVEIPAGQQVLVCLGAANRDPDVHRRPRPPRRRPPAAQRTSGSATASTSASAPRWPGSKAGVAFTALLRRFPDLRLAVPRGRARAGPTATASCCAASPSYRSASFGDAATGAARSSTPSSVPRRTASRRLATCSLDEDRRDVVVDGLGAR